MDLRVCWFESALLFVPHASLILARIQVVSMRTTINATYALHALVPTLGKQSVKILCFEVTAIVMKFVFVQGQFFAEIMRYDGNELYCA